MRPYLTLPFLALTVEEGELCEPTFLADFEKRYFEEIQLVSGFTPTPTLMVIQTLLDRMNDEILLSVEDFKTCQEIGDFSVEGRKKSWRSSPKWIISTLLKSSSRRLAHRYPQLFGAVGIGDWLTPRFLWPLSQEVNVSTGRGKLNPTLCGC